MKKFKRTRKILALLLSLSLITGMMPATALSAFAAEAPVVVDSAVIMSDLHTTKSDNKSSTVTGVLQQIKNAGKDASTVTSAGDMFSVNESNYNCNTSAITEAIKSVYSEAQIDYLWSDHDRAATEISKESRLVYGTGQDEEYYIYLLSMADLSSWDRYNAGFYNATEIGNHIEAFKNTAEGLDKTKPLFIVGHQPLFNDRGDNGYAYQWATAINEVAASMDVAYFHGHNHNYDEASNYYYAKGDTMSIPTTKVLSGSGYSTKLEAKNVKLEFTHINAGYMSPSTGNTSNTRMGTALAVTIYEDSIQYTTYNKNGVYTGNFAVDKNVKRDFAPEAKILSSIAVTTQPTKTVYAVGESIDTTGMIVTATYSDGSTTPVTEYTVSDVDMLTAGTKAVTVTYEGVTATFDITVNETVNKVVTEDAIVSISAESLGLKDIQIENVVDKVNLSEKLSDYIVYNVALDGYHEDEQVEYVITLPDGMTTTNLKLYSIAEDGVETELEYTPGVTADGFATVTFSAAYEGTFAAGYEVINIPSDAVLKDVKITNLPSTVKYFKCENTTEDLPLNIVDLVVTATYKGESGEVTKDIPWNEFGKIADGYSLTFDMTKLGKQDVVISYTYGNTILTATYEIEIFDSMFKDDTTGIIVEPSVPGVTAMNVKNNTDAEIVVNAMKKYARDYVSYDINLEGHTKGDEVTVTLPIPDGYTNPVAFYVSDSGKSVVDMKAVVDNENKTVTFTTDHFSTYVVGDGVEITVPDNVTVSGNKTITTTKTIYKLVSRLTAGKEYLIVNRNRAGSGYGLADSTTGVNVTVESADSTSGVVYIEDKGTALEWTASNGWSFSSGSNDLGYSNALSFSTDDEWTFNNNRLYQSVGQRTYYLRCNRGTWSASTSSSNVYFYEKTEVETENTVSGTYSVEGQDETVAAVKDATVDMSSILTFAPTSGSATTEDVSEKAVYEVYDADTTDLVKTGDPLGVITKIEGNVVTLSGNTGKALVKVSYDTNGNTAGGIVTDYITINATTPHHFGIQLHKADMTEATGVTADNVTNYYLFNETTGVYEKATSYEEGTTYYTTPVTQGDEITDTIALKGIKEDDTYSVWAVVKAYATAEDADGVDIGELGDDLTWTVSDESIATIDEDTGVITFTGENYGKFTVTVAYEGSNGKVITDTITLSVTESLYVVPGDGTNDFPEYPSEGAVRFDKTATAVGNFSETGIAQVELSMTGVPYSTDNRMDVVLMLDRSSSMAKDNVKDIRIPATIEATKTFIKNIVINEDGSFNNNRIMVMDFLGGNTAQGSQHQYKRNLYTLNDEAGYEIISNQAELEALFARIDDEKNGFVGQTTLYGTEYAKGLKDCYDALHKSQTDGNKQFCVFMSDGIPNYMMGEKTHFESTNDIVAMFDVSNRTSDNGTASRNAAKYEYEYYSTKMKDEGVTVFTVGLGLKNENSAWSKTSPAVCEQVANMLLNDISGPAGEKTTDRNTGNAVSKLGKYFFSVTDSGAASGMANVFETIALSIKEAARDIVVEDKIGNKYSLNFKMPEHVSVDETDGLSEFYIQVVDYVLDANKERTDKYTVKENFTFKSDGTFKSHTVDGTVCTNCNHVTMKNSSVATINGKYFDYKSDSTGEYLTWEEEKLATTELALQYFAHLDNSSDAVGTNHEIPAGTYYTNEYATLTYTNYNDVEVQQEFPKPQMTWNGAQVSYVFYLVNDAGQPVNRAGRVVPFAEAIYVTDVHTKHVIWNDLEQSAGLEAKQLARELVPDVYDLYDNEAFYNIHVYEDEDAVNLNNHFVIGGNVADDYNTGKNWTNAETTYVFNNKSDAVKYNTVGTYIANDGDDTKVSKTYLCKGEGTVSATISVATGVTAANFGQKPYFTEENGKYVLAELYDASATYYEISSASYTVASGETQATVEKMSSTSGGTVINGHVYYIDENGDVYTIVTKRDGTEVREGFDFHNTTVAFAVVWKPELKEDTIVVDYGLDVVVDVNENDAMAAGVVGVRTDKPNVTMNSGTYTSAKATSVSAADKLWTASVENLTSVRFKMNEMGMNAPQKIYYESDVNYYTYDSDNVGTLNTTSMYSSLTVIPATTVYYEDNFVDFASYSKGDNGFTKDQTSKWETAGTVKTATQAVDRPGITASMDAAYDANNIYGYDAAYEKCSEFSLGSAQKITVDAATRGEATFTFYGTGFDVVGMTSKDTGTLTVQVYEGASATGTAAQTKIVDTYYGMEADGTLSPNNPSALYQVPVMKIDGLTYGQYTVKIIAGYSSYFDHATAGKYDLYLDAIRVYDPTGVASGQMTNEVVSNAYNKDGEGWPQYIELRNHMIEASNYKVTENEDGTVSVRGDNLSGAIFIDSSDANTSIADYVTYGPNNELYLASGQSVAFALDQTAADNIADVQIALKVGNGDSVEYKIYDSQKTTAADAKENVLETATDLYYSIKDLASGSIVITNTGDSGILSITNVKVTYKQNPNATTPSEVDGETNSLTPTKLLMTQESATYAVMSLRSITATPEEPVVPDTPVVPEEPEADKPGVDKPEKPVVEPAKVISVKTDKKTYTQGDKIKVTVTTNDEATKVKVGTKTLKTFKTVKGKKTWTTTVKASKIGKLSIGAVAYNKNGTASKKVTKTVAVKQFAPKKFATTLSKSKVKKGAKYTVTVKTSTDVKYVKVNGKKITKYTTDKNKTTKTFKITYKAAKVGKATAKVVTYNKAGYASKAKSKNVTVKNK